MNFYICSKYGGQVVTINWSNFFFNNNSSGATLTDFPD